MKNNNRKKITSIKKYKKNIIYQVSHFIRKKKKMISKDITRKCRYSISAVTLYYFSVEHLHYRCLLPFSN